MKYGRDVICTNFTYGRVFFLAVLLFLSFDCWAACTTGSYNLVTSDGITGNCVAGSCANGRCSKSGYCNSSVSSWDSRYTNCRPYRVTSYSPFGGSDEYCTSSTETCYANEAQYYARITGITCTVFCNTPAEIDSINCINEGRVWQDGECQEPCDAQCMCEEAGMIWTGEDCIQDTSVCDEYRQQCAGLGGKFSGTVYSSPDGNCCSAICNTCSTEAMNRVQQLKISSCCAKGQYADSTFLCGTGAIAGCGMVYSSNVPQDTTESFCRDPSLDAEASAIYAQQCSEENSSSSEDISSSSCEGEGCLVGSSSSCEGEGCGEPGSSGSGSSSSEGGGNSSDSSTGNPNDPYGGCEECPWLDSILDTLKVVKRTTLDIKTCLQVPNACPGLRQPVFAFDTAFRKYLKPLMDSILAVDSLQLKALLKLDTNMLKQMKNDSAMLRNDTNTWVYIDALGNVVDTSVHSMNDTTRKWLSRIADSIGVSTDSLAAHIDSIIRHIPDTILDSIVKYQQYATDNFDSVLYGTGKGFSLVDSLIDSAVHYFKMAGHYDSVYRVMFSDSLGSIHSTIDDLPSRNASAIGYALGYGDTASTNLRGDLNGIREAIEGLGDSIGGFGGGFDTAMYGGNYGARSVDTSYGSWINTMSNRYANLAKNAAGGDWGDSATLETVFVTTPDDTAGNSPRGQDSVADAQYSYLTDTAETMVARAKDTLLKDTSLLRAYYDTLKTEMQIWNFDSILIGPIREAIPDNNTCPEDCFKGQFALPGAGDIAYDYGLCRRWPILMDQDIFMFIRVVLRLLTAVACIYIGMWAIAGGKN